MNTTTTRTHCFASKEEARAAYLDGTAGAICAAWDAYKGRIENADDYMAGYIACARRLGVDLDPTQIEAVRAEYIGKP